MTQQLRDELARIADHGPPVHVTADTWSRGRRARRRDRLVAGAAVLALVAVLGGIAALVVDPSSRIAPAAPVGGPGAVPSSIHPVPVHVQDDASAYTSDLAIGPQSLAFVTGAGTPVVVSATDGRYRLLDLEGWSGPEGRPVALSPDGSGLAVALDDGVRVVDLDSGETTVHAFPPNWFGDQSWRVTTVAWTTDGQEVYYGAAVGDASEIATSRKVDVESGEATPPLLTGTIPALGPAETHWIVSRTSVSASGPQAPTLQLLTIDPPLEPTGIAYVSPDQDTMAIGNSETGGIDLFTGEDETGVTDGSDAAGLPLGWRDDDALVVQQGRSPVTGIALRDTSSPDSPDRVIVDVDSADAATLPRDVSVAVDLLAQPTRDFPEPDWPWSLQQQLTLAGLAALAMLLVAAGVAAWRQRLPWGGSAR